MTELDLDALKAIIAARQDAHRGGVVDSDWIQKVFTLVNAAPSLIAEVERLRAELATAKEEGRRIGREECVDIVMALDPETGLSGYRYPLGDGEYDYAWDRAELCKVFGVDSTARENLIDELAAAQTSVSRLEKEIAAAKVEAEVMRTVVKNIAAVVNAHDIESLSCDRDGETYCACLRDVVKSAAILCGVEAAELEAKS